MKWMFISHTTVNINNRIVNCISASPSHAYFFSKFIYYYITFLDNNIEVDCKFYFPTWKNQQAAADS